MRLKHRNGTVIEKQDTQDCIVSLLYKCVLGRMLLKLLTRPSVSKAAGAFLSSRLSCFLIKPFIENNHLDMNQFEDVEYHSYNEFFSRKIKPESRPVDMNPNHFISPCDSKLTVYPVASNGRFMIKNTEYTLSSLLRNENLASNYVGGQVLVFRLSVDDYHRYCYPLDALKENQVIIQGKLHTVNPIANDVYPIYKENSREYCVLHTKNFGDVVMMEVGALLVGKIVNHSVLKEVKRAQEKGCFQFGGSTIVMAVSKNQLVLDQDILDNSEDGYETIVRYGEKIGTKAI